MAGKDLPADRVGLRGPHTRLEHEQPSVPPAPDQAASPPDARLLFNQDRPADGVELPSGRREDPDLFHGARRTAKSESLEALSYRLLAVRC